MGEQIIVTPGGERLVIVPEAEFLTMREALEDRQDLEAVGEFERRKAAGEEELIPADVVNRLIAGENPVRVWRSFRRMTARELANKTGISAPYISELEGGKKDGSMAVMKKIAEALGVALDDLA